jgi:hypothetical protein
MQEAAGAVMLRPLFRLQSLRNANETGMAIIAPDFIA